MNRKACPDCGDSPCICLKRGPITRTEELEAELWQARATLASLASSVQAARHWLDDRDGPARPERARQVLTTALQRAGITPEEPACAACSGWGTKHASTCVAPRRKR